MDCPSLFYRINILYERQMSRLTGANLFNQKPLGVNDGSSLNTQHILTVFVLLLLAPISIVFQ